MIRKRMCALADDPSSPKPASIPIPGSSEDAY
jgi:hypothetical protein